MLSYQQMQELENEWFSQGHDPAALMEEAASGIARYIEQRFPQSGTLILYLGKGNNAGDAILVGAYLCQLGWRVLARRAYSDTEFKSLPSKYWKQYQTEIEDHERLDLTKLSQGPVLIVDGLLGIGLQSEPKAEIQVLIDEIHEVRRQMSARIVAVDVPSGLLENEENLKAVQADVTVTLGHVKKALLRDYATPYVGRLACVRFKGWPQIDDGRKRLLSPMSLKTWLPYRPFDFHKGQAGRVGIIAGSLRYSGAAILACLGALRGGAGLITLYIKKDAFSVIAPRLPAEVMVKVVEDYRGVLNDRLDVLAIGPGLISANEDEILEVIETASIPVVLDAEALNLMAYSPRDVLEARVNPTLLTPHPGEMQRLADKFSWDALTRLETAQAWISRYPRTTLLLKGSRTIIADSKGQIAYNSTGTPGMASGGMGDVLTGVLAALVVRVETPYEAACLGAWLCGRAAECAIEEGNASEETLSATDIAAHLSKAFWSLRHDEF